MVSVVSNLKVFILLCRLPRFLFGCVILILLISLLVVVGILDHNLGLRPLLILLVYFSFLLYLQVKSLLFKVRFLLLPF